MTNRKWDKDEIELLKTLISYRFKNKDISNILNRTTSAIITKCFELNIKHVIKIGFDDLATTHPVLLEEWDYSKNTISPTQITFGTNTKVWWICKRCNYEWMASISNRCKGKGCPCCAGHALHIGCNDLSTLFPLLASEWDDDKNTKTSNQVRAFSGDFAWWKGKCGHSWKSVIRSRTRIGTGCPICTNKQILKGFNDIWTTHPELCMELVNSDDGYKYSYGSEKELEWKCKKCNNIWITTPCNRTNMKSGCPRCNKSHGEIITENLLIKYNVFYRSPYSFDGCKNILPLRFDFYLPNYNKCIEFNGIQHYREDFIKKMKYYGIGLDDVELTEKRDNIKRDFCKNNNISLLEIPYWDINNIEKILIKELNLVEY